MALTNEEIEKRIADSYEVPNRVLAFTEKPMVSIRTSTYNHGPYIKECIEGVLMQETDFPFEFIIGEDFSTDGTREIVMEYAEKYPEVIRVMTADYNVGSKANGRRCFRACRGKYMALCEGDDYWSKPDKLQQQVNILEQDPTVSLVCTDVDVHYVDSGRKIPSVQKRTGHWSPPPVDVTRAILTKKVGVFTCSVCMRSDLLMKVRSENPEMFSGKYPMGDIQTWLELSGIGKVVQIPESMSTYRVLKSSASRSKDTDHVVNFYGKSLEVHEYYAKKFCDRDVLRFVRGQHFALFMRLAIINKSQSALTAAQKIMETETIPCRHVNDYIVRWAADSATKVAFVAPVMPIMYKVRDFTRRVKVIVMRTIRNIFKK